MKNTYGEKNTKLTIYTIYKNSLVLLLQQLLQKQLITHNKQQL